MIEVEHAAIFQVKVYNEKIPLFRSAMAQLYKEVNKPGFNNDILNRKQKKVFNEIVEAMANESNP